MNSAAALTLIQLLINILVILLYLYISNKYEIPTKKSSIELERPLISVSRNINSFLKPILVGIYFFFIGVICILPILGVIVSSFEVSNGIFSLSNYQMLFNPNISDYIGLPPQNMIRNTIFFGNSAISHGEAVARCRCLDFKGLRVGWGYTGFADIL